MELKISSMIFQSCPRIDSESESMWGEITEIASAQYMLGIEAVLILAFRNRLG